MADLNDSAGVHALRKALASDQLDDGSSGAEVLWSADKVAAAIAAGFPAFAGISASQVVTNATVSFADAFEGASVAVGETGSYLVWFNADVTVDDNGAYMAIALGVNSTTVAANDIDGVTTARQHSSQALINLTNDNRTTITVVARLALSDGDTVHGIFRRVSGQNNARLFNRTLTILRVA